MRKVAIITGASSGIGRATARVLAEKQYDLVILGRDKKRLRAVKGELSKYKITVLAALCDVTKVVDVHNTIDAVLKEFPSIDVLVNNAGYGVYGRLEEMRLKDVNGQMLTNYYGVILMIKECLPSLKKSKGAIVNIASVAGLTGVPNMAAYSATKHAVVGLSESLSYELEDVSVSCVCPGVVKTAFFKGESFKDVSWTKGGLSAHVVAKEILRAIEERKFLYVIPRKRMWQLMFKPFAPRKLLDRVMKKST